MLVVCAFFTFLVVGAPLAMPTGTTGDLSGFVGTVDNEGAFAAYPQPWKWVYQAGDVACHQKAARSFTLNGNQMPFCSRDVAIFVGLTVGLALCVDARRRIYERVVMLPWWAYFALLLPIALDGGFQDFLGFESDNVRRILTGIPAGLAVAFALVFISYEGSFAWARYRASRGTGSEASKDVESAPIEKKKALQP